MSQPRTDDSGRMITLGLLGALILHAVFVAALLASPKTVRIPTATPSRLHMVMTQAGAVSVGVVTTTPPVVPDVPAPRAADRPELSTKAAPQTSKTRPKSEAKLATVTPDGAKSKIKAPIAGAGETGGKGSDLANVDLGGTDFPFPVYQRNIVNRIAENFPKQSGALHAEVMFIIRRDGSVDLDQVHVITSSGNYVFDNAAVGAIEAAVNKKLFGPLPIGYRDDALTVIFKFDPSLIRP
jgi:outer membrane biosynthesis protein TonB